MNNWIAWFLFLPSLLMSNSKEGIEAFVQSNVFYTTELSPYLEIRLHILADRFTKKIERDSLLSIESQVTLILRKDSNMVKAERLLLNSTPQKNLHDIIHLVRWQLPAGNYILETKIEDLRDTSRELSLLDSIEIKNIPLKPHVSGLQLASVIRESKDTINLFYKNGFISEPLPYAVYKETQKLLGAYFETYHCDKLGKRFFYKFNLSKQDSVGNFIVQQEWHKARNARNFDAYYLKHDISNLTSGTYRLTVKLLNESSKEVAESSVEFNRVNPFWDKIAKLVASKVEDHQFFDTLSEPIIDYSLRAMYPLISSLDVDILNNFFKDKKLEEKRIFLFAYWSDQADTARIAFDKFLKYIRKLDAMFYSGFGYGFETARGSIYLRYGKPDEQIAEDKDNGAFPYEIWKYNKILKTGQTNVKFLFYNPDLAGSDFRLLHSTAHGEIHNKNWELELYKNALQEVRGNNPIDANTIPDGYNRRAREYFYN